MAGMEAYILALILSIYLLDKIGKRVIKVGHVVEKVSKVEVCVTNADLRY